MYDNLKFRNAIMSILRKGDVFIMTFSTLSSNENIEAFYDVVMTMNQKDRDAIINSSYEHIASTAIESNIFPFYELRERRRPCALC